MASENYSVSAYFARAHIANTVRIGGDEQALLSTLGLTSELLQEPRARISPLQLATIVKANWETSGDELMGLATAKVKVGVFSLLAERLIECKTLGDVLSETVRFYNLITDALSFQLKVLEGNVQFSVKLTGTEQTNNHLLIEYLLLIWHRFPSWLIGQFIPLNKVWFDFEEPQHSDEYRLMFPCPCHYQAGKCAIEFEATMLKKNVVQSNDELNSYLAEMPLQWFRKQAFHDAYTSHVVRLLEETDSQDESSLEFIAETMHMTSRTLRRKLKSENSSFQQLKDNVRRDKAINLLGDVRISIAEIGREVGFTEPAAFTRAFKHWTGLSPGLYRKGRHK